MEGERKYDLILSIVNGGFADKVMGAAREVGASGGTVMHAIGANINESEKFFGISIQHEKDIVFILVKHEFKNQIMQAISKEVGLNKEGRGITFSLPVDDFCGIAHMLDENTLED